MASLLLLLQSSLGSCFTLLLINQNYNMPWTKGQSGNPSGRRAGTPNKALRESVEGLSIKAVQDLLENFDELSNTDKVKVAQMALKHVLPTYKAIEQTIDTSDNVPTWVNAILNDEYTSDDK